MSVGAIVPVFMFENFEASLSQIDLVDEWTPLVRKIGCQSLCKAWAWHLKIWTSVKQFIRTANVTSGHLLNCSSQPFKIAQFVRLTFKVVKVEIILSVIRIMEAKTGILDASSHLSGFCLPGHILWCVGGTMVLGWKSSWVPFQYMSCFWVHVTLSSFYRVVELGLNTLY